MTLRHALIPLLALVFALGLGGCGSSKSTVDAGQDAGQDAGRDAGQDAGVDAGPMCVPTCTTDLECQNSCPANPAGANCCDMMMGVCFAAVTPTCPSAQDGGMMPY